MLRCIRRYEVIGREAVDANGEYVGKVADTLPADGGGEVELLLVNVGRRFPRPRYLPVTGARVEKDRIHLPMLRTAIDDAPSAEDARWAAPADVARGYWVMNE